MTIYTKSTDFAVKDSLLHGDPAKIVKGAEINTEFGNIATALDAVARNQGSVTDPGAVAGAYSFWADTASGIMKIRNSANNAWQNLFSLNQNDFTLPTNLTFAGTGARIRGDFSNATVADRVLFQSSAVNGSTGLGTVPNGTSVSSAHIAYNAADPTNSAYGALAIDGATVTLAAGVLGTGVALPLAFATGGAERMRIDTAGRVGVGVIPSAWGASFQPLDIGAHGIYGNTTPTGGLNITNNIYNDGTNWRYKGAGAAGIFASWGGAHEWTVCASGAAGAVATLNTVMRLDNSGHLLLGATVLFGPQTRQQIKFNGGGAEYGLAFIPATDSTSAIWFMNAAATGVGSIATTASATSYNTSSDYRLKDSVIEISENESALFIDAVRPVRWKWKIDGSDGAGVIAHEFQSISPSSVRGTKDAMHMRKVFDADGNETGTVEAPDYQSVEYGSSESIAMIFAELKYLRRRVGVLEGVVVP